MKNSTDGHEIHDSIMHGFGFTAPALVVLGMSLFTNLERPNVLAAGPGMPVFVAVWVVLSRVNAVKH